MPVIELDKFPESKIVVLSFLAIVFDILHHIHSLVPLRDAARAACVSRRFLSSWRSFPNLTFNWKTLGFNLDEDTPYETAKKCEEYMAIIYHILENHSGTGVKTLKLNLCPWGNEVTASHLDRWLQTAVKSGILELVVDLPDDHSPKYNFPCLLLSCAASSIQSLSLSSCAFRPTFIIGCLRNLKSLYLRLVPITEEELECFFSCTISLENLEIYQCNEITFLKIPSYLQRLSILQLYSIVSNLHTLVLCSSSEAFYTLGSAHKFLQLRRLKIYCCGSQFQSFDFLSTVSFLEACPVLETFFFSSDQHFGGRQKPTLKDSDADPCHIRKIPGFRHENLKKASITGVRSSKSLIELACQILESCSSLLCLVLDTTSGYDGWNSEAPGLPSSL
ncbi:hypothetical protein BRADI_3g21793v3 [Brachypodium distachyon]|uniref:F-box domain-containing protein n=1 Tax=Brachypodium distachyon TaxID=15368 RepID=A0A2K2CYQ6_BRADI|nr:hypothetical protein BRADI_3g21793v3 [Brachypodium distachyon]